ncbi:hypothetical protein CFI14_10525 [Lactiplantibacillus pentosus]|nr:hypothetical protein CFK27_13375 [Lactiplantibacillus pentosus]AYG41518.1 hypothetical protein CFI14_10525 [Lactiplantibacillus pentosus]AYJ40409.1 hypothetical protein LP314_00045 [Lactiplantibacillus pentosus]MCS8604595.1 hypothetical protein [Lactiplantibacillus pentosus]MCT3298086.1 hypothetical protein [Lactiplantibacillus pentosus]
MSQLTLMLVMTESLFAKKRWLIPSPSNPKAYLVKSSILVSHGVIILKDGLRLMQTFLIKIRLTV